LGQNLLSETFRKVTLDLVYFLIKGKLFRGWLRGKAYVMAAFTAEFVLRGIFSTTTRAGFFEFYSTFTTELLGVRIFCLTFRALHLTPPEK
jgi:hypothetical protein